MDGGSEPIDPKEAEFALSGEAQAALENAKLAPLTVEIMAAAPQDHLRLMAASAWALADVVERDAVLEM
jgi:hypothetical protein